MLVRGFPWRDSLEAPDEVEGVAVLEDVVPADDKKNARLIVSQILVDTLAALDMRYPPTSPQRREKLLEIRRQLEAGEV